jgi:hypothetical protein
MTVKRKPDNKESDRLEAFRLMKRDRTLAKAEGIAGLAIADACSMREGVCRKSLSTLAAEHKTSIRQIEYGLYGRRRKNGDWYFTGLLKKGIVFVIADGRKTDGVPTTYGINMDVLRNLANGTDPSAQTSAQTSAQNHADLRTTAADLCTNLRTNAAKVLSSSVEGSKNSSLGGRESSESIPPAAAKKSQSLSPSPTSCEKTFTEESPQKNEEQMKLGMFAEQREWTIARDKRVQETLDEIETEAHRWCGHDKAGNELSDRPNFNQKGKELILQALVKSENHRYDENRRDDEGWPDDPFERGPELRCYDEGIKNIVKEAMESSDAFALKNFSTNLGSSLYGALKQMYEAREEAEMERRRKAAEKYIADFMQHVRDEDFGDAWVKMHPAPNKFSVIKEKINAAIKAERDRRAGEKASASA